MKTCRWRGVRGAGVLGLVLCTLAVFATSASATTMVYADVERLTEISTVIVLGTVTDTRTVHDKRDDSIMTSWTMRVDEFYKDEVGVSETGQELVFHQYGGRSGDLVTFIPGDVRMSLGERVVMFLHGDDPAELYPSALGQSRFLIAESKDQPATMRYLDSETYEALQTIEPVRAEGLPRVIVHPSELERVEGEQLPVLPAEVFRDLRALSFYDHDRSTPVFHMHDLERLTLSELEARIRRAVEQGGAR